MAITKRPKRANDAARSKLSSVASVLAQSKVVSDAFGRAAGFVLIMTGLFVLLAVSITTVIVVGKGASIVLASFTKFLL